MVPLVTLSCTVPTAGRVVPPYAVILDFVTVTCVSLWSLAACRYSWSGITLHCAPVST